ncbi:hypothetical protein [Cutibacterium sp.]|uniref:VG15 protein n=1 Tax=Cutibacterium sp. TaxID=1912221 RepID=UPI0026DC9175|nr:hypothetical protein [Cutibacterium sp.]MDO4413043.1 hypothetical protein [Cutibacterium sp.]
MGLAALVSTLSQIIAALTPRVARLVLTAFAHRDPEGAWKAVASQALTEQVRQARTQAYQAAREFIITEFAASDPAPGAMPYIPSAAGYPQQSVDTLLEAHATKTPEDAAAAISAALASHVRDAARQTIERTAEDGLTPDPGEQAARTHLDTDQYTSLVDQVDWQALADEIDHIDAEAATRAAEDTPHLVRAASWARVLTGPNNCPFCIVVASRGPVYGSAEKAGALTATPKPPGVDTPSNRFHTGCDCAVVPIYNTATSPYRQQWETLERWYRDQIDAADLDRIRSDNIPIASVRQALQDGRRPDIPDIRATDYNLPDFTDNNLHHVLDGEPDGRRGGHRSGTGRPYKTEFPSEWSDEDIRDAISQTMAAPSKVATKDAMVYFYREVNGVIVCYQARRHQRTGELSFYAAYPFNGNGVVRNDRDKDTPGGTKQTPIPLNWNDVDKKHKPAKKNS